LIRVSFNTIRQSDFDSPPIGKDLLKRIFPVLLLIFFIFFLLLNLTFFLPSPYAQAYTVKHVIDGDTLLTNGEYVRLIGVDIPETKHPQKPVEYFGKEAYQFTKGMFEGKKSGLNMTRPEETGITASLRMSILRMGLS